MESISIKMDTASNAKPIVSIVLKIYYLILIAVPYAQLHSSSFKAIVY